MYVLDNKNAKKIIKKKGKKKKEKIKNNKI